MLGAPPHALQTIRIGNAPTVAALLSDAPAHFSELVGDTAFLRAQA
jgi:hypothetical protein